MLAEISDKMPGIAGLWHDMAVIAVPFALGLIHRRLAWALLPFGMGLSALSAFMAYHEAFLEGAFSDAVWRELGAVWVINSIASTVLPAATALIAVGWWLGKARKGQPKQRSHASCAGRDETQPPPAGGNT